MATKTKKAIGKKSSKSNSMRIGIFVALFAIIGAVAVISAYAARGTVTGTCRFDNTTYAPNNWVMASGLPTNKTINFFITDASGKTGRPLGTASDGTTSTIVPTPNGPTTYEFTGRGYGSSSTPKYDVYATCTAG